MRADVFQFDERNKKIQRETTFFFNKNRKTNNRTFRSSIRTVPSLVVLRWLKNFNVLSDLNGLKQNLPLLLLLISLLLYHSDGSSFPSVYITATTCRRECWWSNRWRARERERENTRELAPRQALSLNIKREQKSQAETTGVKTAKQAHVCVCVYISTMILLQRKSKLEEAGRYLDEKKKRRNNGSKQPSLELSDCWSS